LKHIEKEINTLLLSGGGIKVAASLTALEKAYNSDLFFFNLDHIFGVSAGSFLAITIILNYTFSEIKEELLSLNYKNLTTIQFSNLLTEWGVESGQKIIKWVECLIIKKGISPKVTFKELYDIYPIKYTVLAFNLNKMEYEYFNHLNTPDMSITTAMRYSMNIPCFFTKQTYKNDLIVDAGLVSNFPCEIFSKNIKNVSNENDIDNLLGVYLLKNEDYVNESEVKTFVDYFLRIFDIISIKFDKGELTNNHLNHPYIIHIYNIKLSAVTFEVNLDTINLLFLKGEESYNKFEEDLLNSD
jgi:NTE family protein